MKIRIFLLPAITVSLLSPILPARGDVAFTTLSPSGTYNQGSGDGAWNIDSPRGDYVSYAISFVPTVSGNLSSIKVAASVEDAPTDDGNFVLTLEANPSGLPFAANGGPIASEALASASLSTTVPIGSSDSALTTFNYSGSSVMLTAGTTYWLIMTPGDLSSYVIWNATTTSPDPAATEDYIYESGQVFGPYYTGGAFEVDASLVPEPSTWAMLGMGGVGLLIAARRKAQA